MFIYGKKIESRKALALKKHDSANMIRGAVREAYFL